MQLLREGDTVKVTRLGRLSRSVLHLVTLEVPGLEHQLGGPGLLDLGRPDPPTP